MRTCGLQLRVKPLQQKPKPHFPNPIGFCDDDNYDNVEREISRQAHKNKSLKDVEEQQRKTLEEVPLAFDYDGVYDQMKQKATRPVARDRQERRPKYIEALIEKAKQREREHRINCERKLAKERSQVEHLYADKDKFITTSYKRTLAEQAKWIEKERLRELREVKEDVTKKKDMTAFYSSLHKNVAFGSGEVEFNKSKKQSEEVVTKSPEPERVSLSRNPEAESSKVKQHENEISCSPREQCHEADLKPDSNDSAQGNAINQPTPTEQPNDNHYKRSHDALTEAKQRFMARKRQRISRCFI